MKDHPNKQAMEISKEDQERIEKDAEERVPKLLGDSPHHIGTISVNAMEASIRQVAVENQIEGATHEHLTQVLPLREKLEAWDKDKAVWIQLVEEMREKLAKKGKEIENWAGLAGTKEAVIQYLKEENESLKHDIADLRSYCGMTVTEQNSMLEKIERLREALNKFLGIAQIRSLNETSLFTKSEKEEIYTLLTETKKP